MLYQNSFLFFLPTLSEISIRAGHIVSKHGRLTITSVLQIDMTGSITKKGGEKTCRRRGSYTEIERLSIPVETNLWDN